MKQHYDREIYMSEYVTIPKARLRRLIVTEVIAWGISIFLLLISVLRQERNMNYYKVMVEFRQVYELVVKARDRDWARDKAKEKWSGEDPVFSDVEVFDVVELGEKQ